MPLYDYQCKNCGTVQEWFCGINERPATLPCIGCNGKAVRVLSCGHGGIQCDSINDVKWMPSALKTLQPDSERPIQTRGEYNRYLKERGFYCKG